MFVPRTKHYHFHGKHPPHPRPPPPSLSPFSPFSTPLPPFLFRLVSSFPSLPMPNPPLSPPTPLSTTIRILIINPPLLSLLPPLQTPRRIHLPKIQIPHRGLEPIPRHTDQIRLRLPIRVIAELAQDGRQVAVLDLRKSRVHLVRGERGRGDVVCRLRRRWGRWRWVVGRGLLAVWLFRVFFAREVFCNNVISVIKMGGMEDPPPSHPCIVVISHRSVRIVDRKSDKRKKNKVDLHRMFTLLLRLEPSSRFQNLTHSTEQT